MKKKLNDSKKNSVSISRERLEYLERLEKEKKLRELKEELPHLYAHKLYPWQKEFIEETNRQCWLSAANQIGKSVAQIIKVITLATSPELWKKYWPNHTPKTFWYFYPKKETATIEFEEKWKKVYLPKGKMKNSPKYGWKEDIRQKDIHAIRFKTGITVYFMSYEMKPENIQATTVDYIAVDEELPQRIYPELQARLIATNGMFSCVFTATKGQDWVRRIIEGKGEERVFPNSWRRQISMYDCQYYEDGSPTKFTDEYIEEIKQGMPNDTEIQRRVYGKFVVAGGLVYPSFDLKRHVLAKFQIPKEWKIWAGVDIGSGGESGHPAAIALIATNPDYTKGIIFDGWRGDLETTTSSDILKKYLEMTKDLQVIGAAYDYAGAGKDFGIIATRMGIPFRKAEKANRDRGIDTVNTLFKNDMLYILDSKETRKLADELSYLKIETAKQKAKDDFIDAAKYGIIQIPWDFSKINGPVKIEIKPTKILNPRDEYIEKQKKGLHLKEELKEAEDTIFGELEEWNDYYDE